MPCARIPGHRGVSAESLSGALSGFRGPGGEFPRSAARLLLATGDAIRDLHVRDLVDVFRPGDRLELNNTRVIPARLFGTRRRGEAGVRV